MALRGPIAVPQDQVFPRGVFAMGEPTRTRDFDRSTAEVPVYAIDPATGLPVWEIPLLDGDWELPATSRAIKVKIVAKEAPTLPPRPAGMGEIPLIPVDLEGLAVVPYVNQQQRLAYSLRASGIRAAARQIPAPSKVEQQTK
jgi:hypothetical protein